MQSRPFGAVKVDFILLFPDSLHWKVSESNLTGAKVISHWLEPKGRWERYFSLLKATRKRLISLTAQSRFRKRKKKKLGAKELNSLSFWMYAL